jgi:hypothetical protein
MRAIIVGAPIEVEGEPAEIAQLVELMTSGVVKVEHVHRHRLDDPDDNGIQRGVCWCGDARTYAPWDAANRSNVPTIAKAATPIAQPNVVAVRRSKAPKAAKGARRCKRCRQPGHRADNCTAQLQAA